MRSVKHWLSALLCLALALGLLPTAAWAEGHWADSAVTALRAVYGQDAGFAANDNAMTEGQAAALLESMGCSSEEFSEGSDTPLTRAKACEALADVFCLPLENGEDAINYLAEKHIISGTAEGDLNEDGAVSQAEFAVLTYRVLNSVGGGKGSSTGLNPGSDAYFAWMYLYARKYEGVKFDTTTHQGKITSDVWKNWCDKAKNEDRANIAGAESDYPTTGTTMLDAAVKLVFEYIQPTEGQIFSDVEPGSPVYDGVMYLFDQGILSGKGAGSFEPAGTVSRTEFAILLCRVDKHANTGNQQDGFAGAKAYVTASDREYMTVPAEYTEDPSEWWSGTITRQEAITGIMKAVAGTDSAKANIAILDQFSDADQVSEDAAPYVAYAVSLGLVSGTKEGGADPTGSVNRGTVGVLLYRTLLGVDKTKMEDYRNFVKDLALVETPESTAAYGLPIAAFRLGTDVAPLTDTQKTLTLQEDWRLTENLNLAVPEGTTLTITGGCIYEMEGTLQNSGAGTVAFDGAILYPASGDKNLDSVVVEGAWDAGESAALMKLRQPATEPEDPDPEGPDPEQPDPGEPEVPEEPDTPSTPSSGSSSRPSNTTTTTERNPDGSTTTTTTNRLTGTVTETTRYPDGSREVVETKKDGTVTTTTTDTDGNETAVAEHPNGSREVSVERADGTSASAVTDADGRIQAEVSLSSRAVSAAQEDGGAVTLPIPEVPVSDSSEDASLVEIALPRSTGAVKVEIPVADAGPGTVAVIVNDDGTETVVKKSSALDGGLILTLETDATVKIADNSKDFDDTYGHWAEDAIAFATAHEMFGGTSADTFSPDTPMTRGMLAVVLHRFEDTPNHTFTGSFGDVALGSWYADGIHWMADNGIIGGYGNGNFGADDSITREQLATILYRYAGVMGYGTSGSASLDRFSDVDSVSGYAVEAMGWAVGNGLIGGVGDGTLAPQGNATRAQVATILMRFVENLAK